MTDLGRARLRSAVPADAASLLRLWALLFDGHADAADGSWRDAALDWFARAVGDDGAAHVPVIDVDGVPVAAAIGTLEIGVPNPHCPRGRTARLANVITDPGHRGKGYGTQLVLDVVGWARSIAADRVDLSATPDGQRLYQRLGFVPTSAPRMKLVL